MLILKQITDFFPPMLLCLALFTLALAQDDQGAKKTQLQLPAGSSIVSGRALYEDTGQPAKRERVQLIASEALSNPRGPLRIPTAVTNDSGEFTLRRISAAEYYVVARPVDEHVPSGQILPFVSSSALDPVKVEQFKKDYIRITVDGQHNLELNLRVPNPHFGIISGRILDSAGKPAVRASVHLMSKSERGFGGSVLTDEQGQYRFLGLPAGEYIISASPPVSRDDGVIRRVEGVLGATYFPSTLESLNSPPVTVFPDRDTNNIDVTLIARNLHSLAGTVQMRGDTQPVTNATLRLSRKDFAVQSYDSSKGAGIESAMSNYLTSTDKSGHWSIANVPDGDYRLFIQPIAGEPAKLRFVQEERDLTVDGADIENLLVEVSEGSRISGVVTIERNSDSPQSINIHASRYKGNANSFAKLDGAGTFSLTAVPEGEVTLSAFPSPQDRFYVKSITANGLDLLRTNLTIAEGDEIRDVRIVISPNVGVVAGRVLSLTGKPIEGINVILYRMGEDKPRLLGGKLGDVTDKRGTFALSAAPGVYVVLAWRASDGPPAFADAMNRALHEQGAGLTLSPSDRKQVDIRVP